MSIQPSRLVERLGGLFGSLGSFSFRFSLKISRRDFLKHPSFKSQTSPINISTSSDICPRLLHQLLLCHQYFSTLGSSSSASNALENNPQKSLSFKGSEPSICSELNQSLADLTTFNPWRDKNQLKFSQPLLKQLCLQVAFLRSKVKGAPTIFFNLNHSKLLQRITEFNHFWIFLEEMALKTKKIYYTQCFEVQRSLLHWSQLGLISAVGHNPQSLKKRAKIELTKTNGPIGRVENSNCRYWGFCPFEQKTWELLWSTWQRWLRNQILQYLWLSMAAKPQVKLWKGTA